MPPHVPATNTDDSNLNPGRIKAATWNLVRRFASGLVCAFFLGSALAYAWTALCAEINFAWRQPMFDQWRLYRTFLSLPFPANVLQLENGHRPIFPNLLRVAEIHWLAADQRLQITCGTAFAFLTAALMAFSALRERSATFIARSAGAMLAVIGVLWLANARMLLHGNESVHAYLLTLCVVAASLLVHRAGRCGSFTSLAASSAACVVAMFCFGPGAASFASVVLLALIMRVPARWLLAPFTMLAGCLILYVLVLPGSQGVRHMLDIRPWESIRIMAQWLSSPWINGWLGLADPPATWVILDKPELTNRLLHASANALAETTGISWRGLGMAISFAGIVIFSMRTTIALWRGARDLTAWESVAIGVGSFALLCATIFAVGRMDYLHEYPNQVYADRYMIWPSLFWCALAYLITFDLAHAQAKCAQIAGIIFLVIMPFALWPAHRQGVEWASIVYRDAQEDAAAARSGVFDADKFPDNAGASKPTVLATLDLLRRDHLAMFADQNWQLVGKTCPWPIADSHDFSVQARISSHGLDGNTGTPFAIVNGVVASGIAQIQKSGQLAIVSSHDEIVGLVEFSHLKPGSGALRFDTPRKRGFDGYIRHFNPRETYTLVMLMPEARQGLRLVSLKSPR